MSGIAAAVAGSAIIGAVASRSGSRRAADTAQKTSDEQLNYMAEQEGKARQDINKFIPAATQSRLAGTQQAMDLLSRSAPMTMDAFQQGNMGAQNILAGSMPQIQNALMGGAVNYDFMQPQRVNVDLQGLLAGVPNVYNPPRQEDQSPPGNVPAPNIGIPDIFKGNQFAAGGGYRGLNFRDFGSQNTMRLR